MDCGNRSHIFVFIRGTYKYIEKSHFLDGGNNNYNISLYHSIIWGANVKYYVYLHRFVCATMTLLIVLCSL